MKTGRVREVHGGRTIRSINLALASLGFAVAFSTAIAASAQEQASRLAEDQSSSLDDAFKRGWRSATAGVGVLFSPVGGEAPKPPVNYVSVTAQAGYMLFDARGSGFFRGNWELAPEVFGAGIWTSHGSYMAGCTLWIRQNFVQPGWKVTPFLQLGCGVGTSDIPHQYVGQDFAFNLDSSLGLRYFISPRLSVNAEFRYQHFSNANTADHNIGINAIGPMFGVSWIF